MVYFKGIAPEIRAYIKLKCHVNAHIVAKEVNVSLSQVYRIRKECFRHDPNKNMKATKHPGGRPRKLSIRTQRNLIRQLNLLREKEPNWTIKRLIEVAGVSNVSVRTVNRFLNESGYSYLQARRKGLLSNGDRKKRVAFARRMVKENTKCFWMNEISFYLDGVSFAHKRNPKSYAVAPSGRVWRKKGEGLLSGCLARGNKCGTGGNYVKLICAVSYDKGLIAAIPYEKMNGEYFASFLRDNFKELHSRSGKESTKWIQDGDPSQNSALAKAEMLKLNSNLVSIPARSPDLNPIENVFHLVRRKLASDAIAADITFETKTEFEARIIHTMNNISVTTINKTIGSMHKRLKCIIKCDGNRLKY